jgi:hypothetical protein
MSRTRRGLDAVMRIFPTEYRETHEAEIMTTILDAEQEAGPSVGIGDLVSLAVAGSRIRLRSYATAAWRDELEQGVILGIRSYLFFLAAGVPMFVALISLRGISLWGGYGYEAGKRVLVAAMLLPWLVVFGLHLIGRWRSAFLVAMVSAAGVVATVGYEAVVDPFGLGGGMRDAIWVTLLGVLLVGLGERRNLGPVRRPILWMVLWLGATLGLGFYFRDGYVWEVSRLVTTVGVALLLVAIGMAVAGKPRGLVAWALLLVPGWLLSASLLYAGASAGVFLIEIVVWTTAAIGVAFTCVWVAVVVARRSRAFD